MTASKSTLEMRARRILLLEVIAVGLLAGLAAGLILNWRWIRGHEEFRWRRYPLPGIDDRVWITVGVCAAVGIVLYWLIARHARAGASGRSITGLRVIIFLAALTVQLGLLYLEHPQPVSTLLYRTVSTRNLGAFFYDASTIVDIHDRLRRFPEWMPQFEASSPRTHPPGLQVLFWASSQVMQSWPELAGAISAELRTYLCVDPAAPVFHLSNATLASTVIQIAMPLWSALTVLPFFGLARRLFGEHAALRGAALLVFTPSLVLFGAHWDHFYALLALTSLYVAHRGLESQRWWPFLIAGFLISVATFLSFGNLALIGMVGVYALVFSLARHRSEAFTPGRKAAIFRTIFSQLAALGAGAVSVWLIYHLAYGVSFFDVLAVGLDMHAAITGYRTYTVWLFHNLLDFFLFLGIPAVLLVFSGWGRMVRQPGQRRLRLETVPVWTFVITLLALDLSGIARGEVARLWQFLVPVAVLAVAPVAGRRSNRSTAVLLAVLIAQLILLAYFVRTIGYSDFLFYAPRATQTHPPPMSNSVEAFLGDGNEIRLLGYDLAYPDSQSPGLLRVTLYWQPEQRLPHDYTVFVHLIDEAGRLRAQHDAMPQGNALPTSCWQPGEIVADEHSLPLDPDMRPGLYTLNVGMYRLDLLWAGEVNHRLPVRIGGYIDDHLSMTSILIKPLDSK